MLDESFNGNLACDKWHYSGMLRATGKLGKNGLAFVFSRDERKGVDEVKGGGKGWARSKR